MVGELAAFNVVGEPRVRVPVLGESMKRRAEMVRVEKATVS